MSPADDIPRARDAERPLGELVADVSEKTSLLVREEIELAKAEVREKVEKLVRGSVIGLAAGIFAFLGLILIMHGVAWLLTDLLFNGDPWVGFFAEAALFLAIAGIAGLVAARSLQSGAPPTPDMAIEEAKRTKTMLERETGGAS